MIYHPRKPETAVILAGGYGKRLLPHTVTKPKPLLSVDGAPVIDRTFCALKKARIDRVVIVIGHLGDMLRRYISGNFSSDFVLTFVNQKNMMGTADALSHSGKFLTAEKNDYFLALAGDYLLPDSYIKELLDFHISGVHEISVSLRPISPDKIRESSFVDLGGDQQIFYIHEKPHVLPSKSHPMAATLIYVLPSTVFEFIDDTEMGKRGEKELPHVVNRMIASGMKAVGFIQASIPDWEADY